MKRYFFISYSINTPTGSGFGNSGFISDDGFFNLQAITKLISKENCSDIDVKYISILNFYEFNNEEDFKKFFHKE